jgi:ribosome-associated protein
VDRRATSLPRRERLKADVEPRASEALARRIAAVALDKKARDVAVLDMRAVVAYTDFLVIATGNTERQTQAIEDAIYHEMKSGSGESRTPERVEGKPEARWILMDYLDCVVHIFTPAARDYYRLETLWGEVPALEVGEA